MGWLFQRVVPAQHMAEAKCGSRACWGGAMGIGLVGGLVMIIAACAVGACSCDNVCKELKDKGLSAKCSSIFGGCDKGYDANKCAKSMLNSKTCTSDCDTGGMSVGGFFAVLIIGIILLILGCVFICGVVPCCCFKGPDVTPVQPGVAVAVPPAVVVQPAP